MNAKTLEIKKLCFCAGFSILILSNGWLIGQDNHKLDFEADIKPILSERCFQCHGSDESTRKANMRLDQPEVGFDSGIVPGRPFESELIARITSDDPRKVMPPPAAKKQALTASDIKKLKTWIQQGAKHYSKDEIDAYIKDMIKGGRQVREKVLSQSNGIFKDMNVFRDGEQNGVVFKYVYAKGVSVDESKLTPSAIKSIMIPQIKGDRNSRFALNMGIYVKLVYESADGQIYGEARISKEDLRATETTHLSNDEQNQINSASSSRAI